MISIVLYAPMGEKLKIDILELLQNLRFVAPTKDFNFERMLAEGYRACSSVGDVSTTTISISSESRGEGKTVLASAIANYLVGLKIKVFVEDDMNPHLLRVMTARERDERTRAILESDVHIVVNESESVVRKGRREYLQ